MAVIEFLRRHLLPIQADDNLPDHTHPHRRRYTAAYRRKLSICKNIWIVSGLIMIAQATPAGILGLGLVTTILSFAILDETQ